MTSNVSTARTSEKLFMFPNLLFTLHQVRSNSFTQLHLVFLPLFSFLIKSPTVVIAGSILLGFAVIVVFKIIYHFRQKQEDQARVEKFLEEYRAEKPARFTYADVKRITGGFKEKLGEGAHGAVFRGKLSNEILVAVKILNNTEGEGKEFINEVGLQTRWWRMHEQC